MQITTHHSSSKGNLYRVDDGRTRLLIEAGVPIKKIKEALDFRLSDIAGCLISHSHGDHARGLKDLLKAGVDCYLTQGTADELSLSGHRLHIIKAGEQFQVGTWTILPFETVHNTSEPVGFLLASGKDRLMFATDTQYIGPRFQGLTHIMIEIDFDRDTLESQIREGGDSMAHAKQVLQNHLSLQTALGFFAANDMSQVREIHLLHLSAGNSDADRFRREVQKATGKPTYIAKE